MYDFEKLPNRRHANSLKWNINDSELPMNIADMDFYCAPPITEAVRAKASLNIYGYTGVPNVYYEAVSHWFAKHHQTTIDPESILFNQGVMPAIGVCVRQLSQINEKILILPPVYHHFYNVIWENNRRVLECPLNYCKQKGFSLNRDAFIKAVSDPEVSLLILCNPQNPTGHIWSADELHFMANACAENDVFIISDEIHGDITDPGLSYTPLIKAAPEHSNNCVLAISPSKAFNIASLHTASLIVPDGNIRKQLAIALRTDGICEPNCFSIESALAAYTQGSSWLDELKVVISKNKDFAIKYLTDQCPGIIIHRPEATFLMFIDCSSLGSKASEFAWFLRDSVGLIVNDGAIFGPGGKGFIRMNIACPKETLIDGLARFASAWSAINQ